MAVVLLAVLPQKAGALPEGFRTPILAFELARTPAEIEALFDAPGSPERAALVRAMDRGNALDFAFMFAYGSFLALFGLGVARASDRRVVPAVLLGPLGAAFDALENRELFRITGALGGDYTAALSSLFAFTWLKWEALAFGLASLAPWLARRGRLSRFAAGGAALTAALGVLAFGARARFAEAFSAAMTLTFVLLFVVAIAEARRGP